ncbi:MAG TPA: nitroreductase family protein, partial [Saprospiraceae bacterium]|nr:nitroreductase family protein [Saprospiraceae bacterium]
MNTPTITDIIRRRRSVYPKMYADRPLSEDIIREVLENANWAPTHRLTEPWRFRVFRGDALRR